MKVAINVCFGGFGISKDCARHMAAAGSEVAAKMVAEHDATLAAFEEYKRSGKKPDKSDFGARMFDLNVKYGTEPEFYGHWDYEQPRHDPHLVAAIEALGEKANGQYSQLRIVEIPDGTDYEISEYDGNEHIAEKHATWR